MTEALTGYDVPTVLASTAITLNAATSVYFYNRIKTLEEELEQTRKHLATIVPTTDPNMKDQIIIMTGAINELNRRLIEVQGKVGAQNKEETQSSTPSKYVRMTESGNTREKQKNSGIRQEEKDKRSAQGYGYSGIRQEEKDKRPAHGYSGNRLAHSKSHPAASATTSPTSATSAESETSSESEDEESLKDEIAAMM